MSYTILVNTSDGFEDCWNPFFTLLEKYWQTDGIPILLNTEFKSFNFNMQNLKSSKCHSQVLNRKLSWSECLMNAIHIIDTPLVLYLQEDYFIDDFVNYSLINEFANMMIADTRIKYIGLTDFGSKPPYLDYVSDNRLAIVSNKSDYRITTQAGLWDKDTLLSYLEKDENGWMFEIFGSARARKRNDLFLTKKVDSQADANKAIISYTPTGIIKGKWHPDIPSVFANNDIIVDFNLRGFYKRKPNLFTKFETGRRLLSHPHKLIKFILNKFNII